MECMAVVAGTLRRTLRTDSTRAGRQSAAVGLPKARTHSTARRQSSRRRTTSVAGRGSKRRAACHSRADLLLVPPRPHGEAGEVGGAQRRGLGLRRALHRHAEQVGLRLQQQIGAAGATVGAHFQGSEVRALLDGRHEVGDLERDAFERGAGDVGRRRTAREAEDRAPRLRVPVRGAEAGERGDEAHAGA